jgi:hypothetical protein
MEDYAVLSALATHFRNATPPTGETLRLVAAFPPESLGATPALVLYEGSDTVSYGASSRTTTLNITAVLHLPLVEFARSYERISKWRTWLRDSLIDGVLLENTAGVGQASIVGTSTDTTDYGDAPMLTITGTIEVVGVEAISASA